MVVGINVGDNGYNGALVIPAQPYLWCSCGGCEPRCDVVLTGFLGECMIGVERLHEIQ